jgi:hypothetical protein
MAYEDSSTIGPRKLVVGIGRACLGAHYLRGATGQIPPDGDLTMAAHKTEKVVLEALPEPLEWGTYFTAKNHHRICSGRNGLEEIDRLPKGDINNPLHTANPDSYKWQRVVKWKNLNPLWGESCVGKRHFDCNSFVRFCIRAVIPQFLMDVKGLTISAIKSKLETIGATGLEQNDMCAADILIRKNCGHIAIAAGDGCRIVQAEWEPTGVHETGPQKWEFHGRIPQKYWLNAPELDVTEPF